MKMQTNGHYLDSIKEESAKINPNIFGSSSHGLGDTLLLTSICKYLPNRVTIQIPEEKKRFACLFQGLANVEITNNIKVIQDIGGGHYSTQKLRNFFGEYANILDNRPLCLYTDRDSEIWAHNYLCGKDNPVLVCPFVAREWAEIRDIPFKICGQIFEHLEGQGQTPILLNSGVLTENKYFTLNDLELPKLICLLRRVGRIHTANTGLYHLGVALGCEVVCYQPSNSPYFNPEEWCYFNHPTITHQTWKV